MITVLMPVFNGEKYTGEAIESILKQTYKDFEFLILNDGSTDGTDEVIQSYLKDDRINYVCNEKNIQLAATLNKGIDLANRKYIARMDADDIALPNRLEKQLAFMEKHPDVGLLGTAFENFGNINGISRYQANHSEIKLKQLHECHILHPSALMRKSVLDKHKLKFDEGYFPAGDYELWSRMSQVTKLHNLPDVLMRYRQDDANLSHTHSGIQESHSNRVKAFLFGLLGMENLTDEDLYLYRDIAYYNYPDDIDQLEKAKILLEDMFNANERTNYFTSDFFNPYIGKLWFHTCYNTKASIKKWTYYRSSKLSELVRPSIKDKTKMQIKSFVSFS